MKKGFVNGKELLVGNFKLLSLHNVSFDIDPVSIKILSLPLLLMANFRNYITIADNIKPFCSSRHTKIKADEC